MATQGTSAVRKRSSQLIPLRIPSVVHSANIAGHLCLPIPGDTTEMSKRCGEEKGLGADKARLELSVALQSLESSRHFLSLSLTQAQP